MSKLTLLPVPEIMKYLNLDDSDKSMVSLLSSSVTDEIEKYTDRILIDHLICEYADGRRSGIFTLKDYPVNNFSNLQLYREDLEFHSVSRRLYTLRPKPGTSDKPVKLIFSDDLSCPSGRRRIRFIYKAGYLPDVLPDDLKIAFCEIISWLLKRLNSRKISAEALFRNIHHVHILMYTQRIPENARKILNFYCRTEKLSLNNSLRMERLFSKENH